MSTTVYPGMLRLLLHDQFSVSVRDHGIQYRRQDVVGDVVDEFGVGAIDLKAGNVVLVIKIGDLVTEVLQSYAVVFGRLPILLILLKINIPMIIDCFKTEIAIFDISNFNSGIDLIGLFNAHRLIIVTVSSHLQIGEEGEGVKNELAGEGERMKSIDAKPALPFLL